MSGEESALLCQMCRSAGRKTRLVIVANRPDTHCAVLACPRCDLALLMGAQ